ncbi:MAG: class I SAM-dependent RNA methyltransferase [Sphingomonadales bacterium]|nr:class I SAM-dependent RNA methyltransferase [Sphingomonadales bacterium]MDE2169516.1 class I SAM-dependent RNA methyltransferase [Sphingomonadales bacterium]
MGAPGDHVRDDGSLRHGPHHAEPACRHYCVCGGCQLQHVDDAALSDFVTERVVNAARSQKMEPEVVAPVHLSPSHSRRRASLHGGRTGGVVLGYKEAQSHQIVNLKECPVLAPELFALIEPLRKMLARRQGKLAVDIDLTLTEQGVDCSIKGYKIEGLAETEAALDFARENNLARLALDQGYGPESLWEPEPVTVSLSGVSVPLPPGAFLQATADGEQALAQAVTGWLRGAPVVADLFAGLGTFAFALAKAGSKVLAVEADRAAHLACKAGASGAGLPVHGLHRDLFRNPLLTDELNRFSGVVIDPPRAGAREQIGRIAGSTVPRVVYISCNPSSWARDAAALVAGGYRLVELRPVGQFRWSNHVELASFFVKD